MCGRPTSFQNALVPGTIPPFSILLEDKPAVEFVRKVQTGAPVTMGDPALHYRGRMPAWPFLQEVEVAAAYMFLVDYPPRPGGARQ